MEGYVILFGLLSPWLAALISGVIVYRRSMKHTVHQSLRAAALTVIISLILLVTVTNYYAKVVSDEYTHRVDPITGE